MQVIYLLHAGYAYTDYPPLLLLMCRRSHRGTFIFTFSHLYQINSNTDKEDCKSLSPAKTILS